MQRMTEEEIRRDVRLSKVPEHQVRVLAELNLTSPNVIRFILDGGTWAEILAGTAKKPHNKWKDWTPDEVELAAKRRQEGRTYLQIATELDRTVKAVRSLADRYPEKFAAKHTYRPFTAEDERIAREMWEDGAILKRIAERLGRASPAVKGYLKRTGLYPRQKERAAHDTAIS